MCKKAENEDKVGEGGNYNYYSKGEMWSPAKRHRAAVLETVNG